MEWEWVLRSRVSMRALLSTLYETAGKHGEVDAVVVNISDSEDQAIEAYLEQSERANSDPNRQHYSISQGHNCGTLICDALGAAGSRSPTPYSFSTPGGIFGGFLTWQQLYGAHRRSYTLRKKRRSIRRSVTQLMERPSASEPSSKR